MASCFCWVANDSLVIEKSVEFLCALGSDKLIALMEAKQEIYFSLQCGEPSTSPAFNTISKKTPQVGK